MNISIDKFAAQLKNNPEVLGIILFGSWAAGTNHADSDADLIIIQAEGVRKSIQRYEDQWFEIMYTNEKDIKEYWYKNRDGCFAFWTDAKILYDKDGTVRRLEEYGKALIHEGKPALSNEEIEFLTFDTKDQLRSLSNYMRTDKETAIILLHRQIFLLSSLYFNLRQLWTPSPKRKLTVLEKLDKGIVDLFRECLRITADDIEQKIQKVQELRERVFLI